MVLSYGLSIQFTDIMFKSFVKKLYPETLDYQRFFAKFSSRVGATTFVVIFFGSNIVKHLGWRIGLVVVHVFFGGWRARKCRYFLLPPATIS